jgi:hypothetical protein
MLTPLTQDHGFFRQDDAAIYWALAPHLLSQHTDTACALASASMTLNALRSLNNHHRIGDVISEQRLLDAMNDDHWRSAFRAETGDGLKLARYGDDMPRALALFDLQDRWSVSIHRVPAGDGQAATQLRDDLIALQRKADRLLIANFHLGVFYGDGYDIGHYSPLGAYDGRQDRVLVLDVYKPSYEPVWAPLEHLAHAMSALDDNGMPRGYLLLTRQPVALA